MEITSHENGTNGATPEGTEGLEVQVVEGVSEEAPPDEDATLERFDREKAQEWLSLYKYERQRELKPNQVNRIAAAIRRGQYSRQALVLCECEGEWHLTDGQHRLHAFVKADRVVWEHVIRKRNLTKKELDEEYARTDGNKPRQGSDYARAFGMAEEFGLTQQQTDVVWASVKVIMSGFTQPKPEIRQTLGLNDPDIVWQEVRKWMPAAVRYFKAIANPKKGRYSHLRLTGAVSVMLVVCQYHPEKGEEFAFILAQETKEADHPCQALLGYFFNERKSNGDGYPQICRRVARAWNAFYADESLAQIRRQDTAKPIEIAGTPYSGLTTASFRTPGRETAEPRRRKRG